MQVQRFIVLFTLLAVPFLLVPRTVSAWTVDSSGRLFSDQRGFVLGKGDSSDSSGSSASSGSESSQDRSGSSGGETQKDRVETTTPFGAQIRSDTRPDETKTEIRFPDDSRIKTETRQDRTRTEVRQGGVKVRLEQRAGEIRLKVENEDTGEEHELPTETDEEKNILTIRERVDKDEVKVSAASGQFVIKRNNVGATSSFPLSVDLATNELTVTTPAGEKRVVVLPDQAVQNMLAANVIDRVGGQATAQVVTENPDLSSLSGIVRLIQARDGQLVYEVQGLKNQKLLGFIPMLINTKAVVSVETGELLETQQSPIDQLIDLVSF